MIYPSLAPYFNRGILHARLLQDAVKEATDALGDDSWEMDLGQGTFAFFSPDGRSIDAVPHMMASIAPGPRSMMWGWALPRGDNVAAWVRDRGRADRIAAMEVDELPFPDGFLEEDGQYDDEAADAATDALAHEVGTALIGVLGRGPYHVAAGGTSNVSPRGASKAVFILDIPSLKPITVADVIVKFMRLTSDGGIVDPSAALLGLAEARKWTAIHDGQGLRISDGKSEMSVKFDHLGRVISFSGTGV